MDFGPITQILEQASPLGYTWGIVIAAVLALVAIALGYERWSKGRPARWERKIPFGIWGIVVLFLFVALASPSVQRTFFFWVPALQPPAQPSQPTSSTTVNQISRTFPLTFQAVDTLKGGAVSSGTIYVYNDQLQLMETLSISSGTATTALKYTSGTPLIVKWVSGNFAYEQKIQVPYAQATTDTSFPPITLSPFMTAPTVAVQVLDPAGNSLTSGANYNVTATGKTKGSFTIIVRITSDNTGLKSFTDYVKVVNGQPIDRTTLLQAYASGSNLQYLILSGIPQAYSPSQTASYYLQDLGPDFVRQLDAQGNVIKNGVYSYTLNYDASSLPKGSTINIQFTVYALGSTIYFSTYHIQPSDAVSLATFTLNIQA
ncbi:MAG: hypothetical protein ACP5GL_08175 [Infirmifilum sp.]